MSGYCHIAPHTLAVDATVNYFATHGKPTIDALETALCHVGRNSGPELLYMLHEERLLTLPACRRVLSAVWVDCEWPEAALDDEYWRGLFDWVDYTVNGRKAERPTAPLALYRGASRERREGWSWTTDPSVAQWFAERSNIFHPEHPARVWKASVNPLFLLACDTATRPGEPQYILDPWGLDEVVEAP